VNTTSSAVNGCPSCQLIPSRRVNVHSVPSGELVQDAASQGSICPVESFHRRLSNMRKVWASPGPRL